MSVHLLRRCLHLQSRCAPVLRSSVHRLYSVHTSSTTEPADGAPCDDAFDTDSALHYSPPKLYSSATVKIPRQRKKKQQLPQKKQAVEAKDVQGPQKPQDSAAQNTLQPKYPEVEREVSSVELHLASLNAAGVTPTLEDLERFRAQRIPDPEHPKYSRRYSQLVDKLCRSFSKEQLYSFMQTYAFSSPQARGGRRKAEYAESIIESWGWPSLAEVEKTKRARVEVSVETHALTRAELFVTLGRDGADLLELSREFNVNITLASEPLGLRVEGIVESLQKFTDRLIELKRGMATKVVKLPTATRIPDEQIQQISRMANAFVENLSDRSVRVAANNEEHLASAERLVIRAAHEISTSSIIPQLSYTSTPVTNNATFNALFAHRYALYPHFPDKSHSLSLSPSRMYRLRRVMDTLSRVAGKAPSRGEGLVSGAGVYTPAGKLVDLKQYLLDSPMTVNGDGSTRKVEALFGHMLFKELGDRKANLVPEFDGYHSFTRVQDWMATSDVRTSFLSSLPYRLTHSLPSGQRALHRLVYHALPSSTQDANNTRADTTLQSPLLHHITLEAALSEPEPVSASGASGSSGAPSASSPAPQLQEGTMQQIDVMLPDRSMDVRFIVTDAVQQKQEDWPMSLQDYVTKLTSFVNGDSDATQPDPPLVIVKNGLEYVLHETSSVRQSEESSPVEAVREDSDAKVTTESILDLENNQKAAHCRVVCNGDSPDAWMNFLEVCDILASSMYVVKSPLQSMIPTAMNVNE